MTQLVIFRTCLLRKLACQSHTKTSFERNLTRRTHDDETNVFATQLLGWPENNKKQKQKEMTSLLKLEDKYLHMQLECQPSSS